MTFPVVSFLHVGMPQTRLLLRVPSSVPSLVKRSAPPVRECEALLRGGGCGGGRLCVREGERDLGAHSTLGPLVPRVPGWEDRSSRV